MYYTVKDVARQTGLTTYTIRYYIKEGLFPRVSVDKRGRHLFTDMDIETFYIIQCLKRCHMTIKEIRSYIDWLDEGDVYIERCLSLFEDKQTVIKKELQRLTECMDAVNYKVWYYQKAKEAGTLSVHNDMSEQDIPEDMKTIRARMKDVQHMIDD